MDATKFKVIIVGGGPTGLVAAHALLKAGIDFVVLEQRASVKVDVGACLVLGPHNLRIMQQLGLLDKLKAIGEELVHHKAFRADGYQYKRSTDFRELKENHGSGLMVFHRAHLVQAIYDGLPDTAKAKYLTRKTVADIVSTNDGVTVSCSDGTTYSGSMVIGADGVHSATRRIMRNLAMQDDPKRSWDDENPFRTEYRCMWSSFPRSSGPGECFETTSKGKSIMYLTGLERGWILCYEKLSKETQERHQYSEEDILAFADSIGDFPVNESLKLKDVFAKRSTAGMSDVEEGIAFNWSWGRIVLLGDSIHRFTPNAGLGLNNGIQDVVSLCNLLHAALQTSEGQPESETVSGVFDAYRQQRFRPLYKDFETAATLTRLHAWANGLYYFMSRFILSRNFFAKLLANRLTSPSISKGLVLNYVSARDLPPGRLTWENAFPDL